jgi:FtsP/CotA-like multicopper oxidase with cupredoxin domain
MTSGIGPYVVNEISSTAGVLETTIIAGKTSMVDLGLGPGLTANVETYNGAIPGPVLKLNVDDDVIVRLINLLDHPTGIHWHGIELSNSADGTEVTQEPVTPAFTVTPSPPAPAGGTYLYKFKVPRPGLYWYHPHHHLSTNRVFRGLYGMIVVADPLEAGLIASNVLPDDAHTKQLVLSDITVAKAVNDTATYVDPTTVVPATDAAEWLSGSVAQPPPTPVDLCVATAGPGGATNDDGTDATVSYAAGDVPSIIRPAGRLNEGQTVLTNGMNVGARPGTPSAPGALPAAAHVLDVESGGGLRLQIGNCATTRYFRLRLTTSSGALVPLFRIGGEGGLLDRARREGGTIGTLDMRFDLGEILLPPGSRADVVAVIPSGETVGSKLTMWTRDFQRTGTFSPGGLPNWSELPSVPVMHLNVTGPAPVPFSITETTALRPAGDLVPTLPAPGPADILLTPVGGFVAPKSGMSNQDIKLNAGGAVTSVDSVVGNFEGFVPYSSAPHLGSTRYAELGRTLQLSVTNMSPAHHPFHLHGFSFQPVSLLPRAGAPAGPGTTGGIPAPWPYQEFRDNFDIPGHYTFTFRVHLEDRELVDGVTMGGAYGRWLFHCHIFFHHHQGMISELVVTDVNGIEKPNVDVGGSWAYAPSMGIAKRKGTYSSLDSTVTSLTATDAAGTPVGSITSFTPGASGNWEWEYVSPGGDDGVQYVYITATDALGRKDQAVFRLKIGTPDDGADNGDPHILTVDGKYYDFQAAGEFVLLRDTEGLEIQVRQTPVPTANPVIDDYSGLTSCVSVNTAVAARIGAHQIAYQPSKERGGQLEFFLDGKPADLTERGIDLEAGRVVAYPFGGTTVLRVDYVNYTVLTVTPYFWSSYNIWILNVSVSHTDADQGIMGRIPPQTWLPMLPNGAMVGPKPLDLHECYIALYRTFANAWRVTDNTSLFVYEPGTSTKTFTDLDWPAEQPLCDVKPEFQIPGANPPLVNIELETAEQICKPVTPDDLHRGCVFDVATTGDETLVKSYLLAQELRLNGTAVQIVADKIRTQPGESVVFTATVTAMTSGRLTPTGTITFLIDDIEAEKPIDLDQWGRASLKTGSLSTGVRRIRAVYTASGENGFYHNSSSPSLRHRVERLAPTDRSSAPYQLRGFFYEACDCNTICPCWLGNDPDGGECTGVFAWEVEQGSIDGVDVSGLRAVSVSYHAGLRDEARQRVVIFVDDRATRQQADALAAAFSGRLGGPLQELADILGELLGVERAPITLRREGRLTKLTVDRRIRVEGRANEGPSGRRMALNDGKLSNVLGSPAEVGESGRFRVGLAAHGMDLDVRGRSTMSGRFSYVHAPKPNSRVSRGHMG